ncbi:Vitelline membrane outer layer protein 1 [Orchesella cincta]|uniref:Vitelline membrane outer layer protein 1 n=1 Tax=Orchesella cincta TaxID=48709 RepID=A0A1D2MJ14_ORCCI|nr:Vitelline membrane outer layer protein 1 [Orchesella cincta]
MIHRIRLEWLFLQPFLLLFLLHGGDCDGTPEKATCDWVGYRKVERMRDLSDCTKFFYCILGEKPFRGSCPWQDGYYLYFNPNTTHCDFYEFAHKDCFGTGTGTGTGVYVTTTSTTTLPPTTTKPPRPPPLEEADETDFIIDCSKRHCGLFPNTYGACDTYVVCVNGERLEKKCNGGQLFDVKTKECQPAAQATCWKEPNAGPHLRRKSQPECPFHGMSPSTTPLSEDKDEMILQNPVVTNWGIWQAWKECPAGTYATGIYAWRRLLLQGRNSDHVGIVSVSYRCQTPGGNETDKFIESLAPNLPHDGWPMYYMCKGAVVGFRLNSVRDLGAGRDNIATDNVQAMCSCSGPAYKPYEQAIYSPQNGHRGDWTAQQNCKKYQAMTGMQTQMQDIRERQIGIYDNTGMNNFKIRCSTVPDPYSSCIPREKRLLIRTCDNSKSDEGLRCDFDSQIGLSMDYENAEKRIDFYSSIGYTFQENKDKLKERVESRLRSQIENGRKLEYTWDDVIPSTLSDPEVVASHKLFVKPWKKLELYQIVGACGDFVVRTNRFLRMETDGKSGMKQQIYFEI